jgi:transposase
LGRPSGYPRGGVRAKPMRLRLIARLEAQGLSNRAVAQRVGVSENAVRKLLRRLGWRPASGTQEALPLAPAPAQ